RQCEDDVQRLTRATERCAARWGVPDSRNRAHNDRTPQLRDGYVYRRGTSLAGRERSGSRQHRLRPGPPFGGGARQWAPGVDGPRTTRQERERYPYYDHFDPPDLHG